MENYLKKATNKHLSLAFFLGNIFDLMNFYTRGIV